MKNWRDTPWLTLVKYEWVTQKMADSYLTLETPGQRPLRDRKTMQFEEMMRSEKWWPYNPSQVPVMFTPAEERLNGKTRFTAFKRSGIAKLLFPVLRNVPKEVYPFIDADFSGRTPKHALSELENVNRDTARVNWLHGILTGDIYYTSPTGTLGQKLTETYAAQITWAGEIAASSSRICRAPYVVPYMYVHRIDPDFADKWLQAWVTSSGLPPALVRIRDAVMSGPHGKSGPKKLGNMDGGGRAYTHDKPTLKMLNALALLHQKKPLGRTIPETAAGLKYWSNLAQDGAYQAHASNH